ncbi:hypothetical protein M569_02744, partial [Genlisea aurea]
LIDGVVLTQKIGNNRTVVVDAAGNGQFESVQAAIDQVPEGNSEWFVIHLRKGVYREKVRIPRNKPYIFLRGIGKGRTSVVSSDHSSTFTVEAPRFIAFGISFKNEASSVAATVAGDMAAFYHCGFYSNGNTLHDLAGRHYYDRCYVQGSVDFIFGPGLAMFHDSEVFAINGGGSIAANSRGWSHDETAGGGGFVFLDSRIYGVGGAYLGRDGGTHSRVVYANSYMSKAVVPQGWAQQNNATENLYHAEYKCRGPGSVTRNRAHWSKRLTDEEASPFLSVDFVLGKAWLPAW